MKQITGFLGLFHDVHLLMLLHPGIRTVSPVWTCHKLA